MYFSTISKIHRQKKNHFHLISLKVWILLSLKFMTTYIFLKLDQESRDFVIVGSNLLIVQFCYKSHSKNLFLVFHLVTYCITLIDFWILKNPCIPGINPIWSQSVILLMCCWIWFASINILRIFASMFGDIACNFNFFWYLSLALVIRVMVAPQNECGYILSSATSGMSFRKVGMNSSLKAWQNLPVKPSGPGLLFAGRFLITISISLLVIALFIFSLNFQKFFFYSHFLFVPGSVLEDCT